MRDGDEVACWPGGMILTEDEWNGGRPMSCGEVQEVYWITVEKVVLDDRNAESLFTWVRDDLPKRQRVWQWDCDVWIIRERIEIDPWDLSTEIYPQAPYGRDVNHAPHTRETRAMQENQFGPRQCTEDRR